MIFDHFLKWFFFGKQTSTATPLSRLDRLPPTLPTTSDDSGKTWEFHIYQTAERTAVKIIGKSFLARRTIEQYQISALKTQRKHVLLSRENSSDLPSNGASNNKTSIMPFFDVKITFRQVSCFIEKFSENWKAGIFVRSATPKYLVSAALGSHRSCLACMYRTQDGSREKNITQTFVQSSSTQKYNMKISVSIMKTWYFGLDENLTITCAHDEIILKKMENNGIRRPALGINEWPSIYRVSLWAVHIF